MGVAQYPADEDDVVARVHLFVLRAIEPGDHIVDDRRTADLATPVQAGELVGADGGETIRQLALPARQYVDREPTGRGKHIAAVG